MLAPERTYLQVMHPVRALGLYARTLTRLELAGVAIKKENSETFGNEALSDIPAESNQKMELARHAVSKPFTIMTKEAARRAEMLRHVREVSWTEASRDGVSHE